jgi:sigma-E factor negative regulatory protein RseC
METPKGTVVSLSSREGDMHATIDVDVSSSCPRCAAGKGCGAGILAAGSGARQIQVLVDPELGLSEGDVVDLTLAPQNLLRAALIVYGLPMLGAIAGAAIAYALSLGDAGAAVSALVGLACGLLLGRWRLRQTSCLQQFVPTIGRPQ